MKGFLLGLLVAGLGFGGYLIWKEGRKPAAVPTPAVESADAGVAGKKKRKRAREGEPEIRLSAADLKPVGQGDDLSRPDVVRLDLSDQTETAELTQDDIDARFRPEEPAILECISAARPDPETYVPGRVTVK